MLKSSISSWFPLTLTMKCLNVELPRMHSFFFSFCFVLDHKNTAIPVCIMHTHSYTHTHLYTIFMNSLSTKQEISHFFSSPSTSNTSKLLVFKSWLLYFNLWNNLQNSIQWEFTLSARRYMNYPLVGMQAPNLQPIFLPSLSCLIPRTLNSTVYINVHLKQERN